MDSDSDAKSAQSLSRMEGVSTKARSHHLTHRALDWVYRWGFSTGALLDQLLQRKTRGYGSTLHRRGLLDMAQCKAVDTPYIYTLSKTGRALVEEAGTDTLGPFRVRTNRLRHDLLAQAATLNALQAGAITDYFTERMLIEQFGESGKRPDVLWRTPEGFRIAVEFEVSGKWGRTLDNFIAQILTSLMALEADRYEIITTTPAVYQRYQEAFLPGRSLGVPFGKFLWLRKCAASTSVPIDVDQYIGIQLLENDQMS